MKKNFTNFLLAILLIFGVCLLAYPSASNYWNSLHQSKAIATYVDDLEKIDTTEYDKMLEDVREYNRSLLLKPNRWAVSDEERQYYESLLNISGTGVMGYIEIPQINVSLPIYHGCSEEVLQVAVGHIEGTSMPLGGLGTHTVLSGHRGLPSAKLFTDLDKLIVGDVFLMRILNETITYEIDQILIVEPTDVDALVIEQDKDYCTLVTCTPYGVNSHRMLVRGHRIENLEEAKDIRIIAEAIQIEPLLVAPILSIPILLVLLFILIFKK